ncbi:MAG: hypothetical protein WCP18_03530 [bacterium]
MNNLAQRDQTALVDCDQTDEVGFTLADKLKRAEKLRRKQNKSLAKRRNLGRRRAKFDENISRAEFERRFPGLPASAWYMRQYLINNIPSHFDWLDDDDDDLVIPDYDSDHCPYCTANRCR